MGLKFRVGFRVWGLGLPSLSLSLSRADSGSSAGLP